MRSSTTKILFVSIFPLVVIAYAVFSKLSANRVLQYNWKAGDTQQYLVMSDSKTAFSGKLVLSGTITQHVEGTLHFKILSVDSDRITGAVQLSPVKVRVNQVADVGLAQLFSSPVLVKMNRAGNLLDTEFCSAIANDRGAQLRSFLAAFQVVLPRDFKQSWRSEEVDGNGTYQSAYATDEAYSIRKRILGYGGIDTSQLSPQAKIIVHSGQVNALVSQSENWLESLSGTSNMEFAIPEDKSVIRLNSEWSLKSLSLDIRTSPFTKVTTVPELRELLRNCPMPSLNDEKEHALSSRAKILTSGEKLSTLVLALPEGLRAAELLVRGEKIIEHLQQVPEDTAQLVSLINENAVSDSLQAFLIYCLQRADTEQSELALLSMLTNKECSDANKQRAMVALGMAEHPRAATFEGLWQSYEGNRSRSDAELSNSAVLSFGAAAQKIPDPVEAARVQERLSNELQALRSSDPISAATVIRAMGNSAYPGAIGEIDGVLAREDSSSMRLAAAESLARFDGQDVLGILSRTLKSEHHPEVREKLVSAIVAKPPNNERMALAQECALAEPHAPARASLANYLSKNRELYPKNVEVLHSMKAKERDPEVFAQIVQGIPAGH